MRQLDLFGALLETPAQENKQKDKQPIQEKESKKPGSDAGLVAEDPSPEKSESSSNDKEASSPVVLIEVNDIEEVEVITIEDQSTVAIEPGTIEQPEITIDEIRPDYFINPEPPAAIAKEEVETNNAPNISDAKRTKAEVSTKGSVVFDDGKISVKIKNKPVPEEIVAEVKKEKIQKIPQKRGRKSFQEIDAEVDLIDVPEDEILFQKQYYPISEVAKWFRVNASLLRFWENEFDVLKPKKNRKGDRLFRPEDIKNLQLIYQLLRQRKYTIEGAKEYIKTNRKKADVQLQLTQTLQKFKSFLLDLKANLQS